MIERCEFKKYKAATVTVPGLSRNVHIVEDVEAVATGCTGFRVWSCAVLLASELILQADSMRLKGANVVELGCGCGLVGLVAALLGAHVLLTDRDEECLALASASAEANAEGIGAAEGSVKTALLDWDYPQAAEGIPYGASTWVIGSDARVCVLCVREKGLVSRYKQTRVEHCEISGGG
jgi:predicted RNA methylase